jgi:WD40-like Beta Propeller Repeat
VTIEAPPRPPQSDGPPDLEALIEEARRRARRRRLVFLSCALAVIAGVGLALGIYYLVRNTGGAGSRGAGSPGTEGSSGGELLLFGSLAYGHAIYGVRPDGTDLRGLARTGSYQFAISPDGKRIVFARTRRPPGRGRQPTALFVLEIGSHQIHRVTSWSAGGYRAPGWALEGQRIVYGACSSRFSSWSGDCAVWRVRADGSDARNLTKGFKTSGRAAVSPDGRWLAFSTAIPQLSFPSPGDLYVERIDGTQADPRPRSHITSVLVVTARVDRGAEHADGNRRGFAFRSPSSTFQKRLSSDLVSGWV